MEPPSTTIAKSLASDEAHTLSPLSTSPSPPSPTENAQNGAAKPEPDFSGNVFVENDLPNEADLEKCADMPITDEQGRSVPFNSLFTGRGEAKRHLVIFVRHFYCGNCQDYLRMLSSSITPSSLAALPTPTTITIIGCGSPSLISIYRTATSCPFLIYADQTQLLYDVLGMTRTLDLGPRKPDYVQSSILTSIVTSTWQGLKQGPIKAFQGGDVKQVGGEFLFEDGGRKVVWCNRMKYTRDHTEVAELRKLLGLD